MQTNRLIRHIAYDIMQDWKKWNKSPAAPYLSAMLELNTKTDNYYLDSCESVVLYGLANMQGYRGEKAKIYKEELKNCIKE